VVKLREENEERRTVIDKSEEFRELYLEENKKHLREKSEYEKRIKELSDSLAQSKKELERENHTRKNLQGELEKVKERAQESQEEIKSLLKQKDELLYQIRGGNQSFRDGLTSNEGEGDTTRRGREEFQEFARKWGDQADRRSAERTKR